MFGKINLSLVLFAMVCGSMGCASSAVAQDPDAATVTHQVFFDIEIGGESAGRIVMGLFGTMYPKPPITSVPCAPVKRA